MKIVTAMAKLHFSFLFLLYVLIKCETANVDTISSDIRFKNADRTVDKITLKVSLENTGRFPIKNFLVAVEKSAKNNLAFVGTKDSNNKDLRLVETSVKGYDYVKIYRIELKEPVNGGASGLFTIEYVFTKALIPYPNAISQQEDQLVKYIGNIYVYSPYYIATQKSTIVLNTKSIESVTKLKPFTQQDNNIVYGPYTNVGPFSEKELNAHYKNIIA